MSSLPEFLLARIAEDEELAREAVEYSDGLGATVEWRWVRFYSYNRTGNPKGPSSSCFYHGAPPPARVLAECEAKRRIVEMHDGGSRRERRLTSDISLTNERGCGCGGRYPCPTLQLLALPYADHPDYDEGWRP